MTRWIYFLAGIFLPAFVFSQSVHSDSTRYSSSRKTTIQDIGFVGNKNISADKIRGVILSQRTGAFVESVLLNDLKNILNLYAAQHFYLIAIDSVKRNFSSDSAGVKITIYLTENKPVEIGSIRITGCQASEESVLLGLMNSTEGKSLDPAGMEEDIDNMLRWYDDRGFPFAKISVDDIRIYDAESHAKIAIRLHIEQNQPVRLDKMQITGNVETQEKIFIREFRMPLPQPFSQIKIDEGLARIRKLPFIEDAQMTEVVPFGDSAYGLKIAVREGLSNTVDGVAGYVPPRPNSSDKGYFTGLANLSFQNLFGTARHLEVHWQKKNRFSQDLLLAYTEPWAFHAPLNLGVSLQQLVQDTIYTMRQFTFDGIVWMGTNWAGLFGAKLRSVTPTDNATSFLSNIPTANFTSVYIGASYDTRDDRINPRKGLFYRASIEYGKKNETSFSENSAGTDTLIVHPINVIAQRVRQKLNTKKVTMDFEAVMPLGRRWVFFDAVHAAVYKSPQTIIPYSERFLFGGLKSVRGYTQDFFNGSRIGWNNLELRWLTSRRSRLFIFMDTGYYFRNAVENSLLVRQQGWPIGYGFGIRFQTKLGLFGLDYGLGKGDTFATGKVHFGITSQF
jgi:outer membrane protein assembly factor BamA